MPSSGLASLIQMRPTEHVDRLPHPPAGHIEIPTGLPGQTLFVPPDASDAFIQLILADMRQRAQEPPPTPTWRAPEPGLRPFFEGNQRYGKPLQGVSHWPTAPSADAYEIAKDDEDADRILSEGGKPLIWWRDTEPDFSALARAVEEQYSAPGLGRVPLFSADAAGNLFRTNPDYEPRRIQSGSVIPSGGLSTLMHLLGGGR